MEKNKVLTTTAILLVVFGIVMVYLGGIAAQEIMMPPIITGVGFFLIAWALNALKDEL